MERQYPAPLGRGFADGEYGGEAWPPPKHANPGRAFRKRVLNALLHSKVAYPILTIQ
jgi:hypothetical protein